MKVTLKDQYMYKHTRDADRYLNLYSDDASDENWAFMCRVDLEFEAPDNFDPRPVAIKALNEAKAKVMAEAQLKLVEIDRQIGELLAIEGPRDAIQEAPRHE